MFRDFVATDRACPLLSGAGVRTTVPDGIANRGGHMRDRIQVFLCTCAAGCRMAARSRTSCAKATAMVCMRTISVLVAGVASSPRSSPSPTSKPGRSPSLPTGAPSSSRSARSFTPSCWPKGSRHSGARSVSRRNSWSVSTRLFALPDGPDDRAQEPTCEPPRVVICGPTTGRTPSREWSRLGTVECNGRR